MWNRLPCGGSAGEKAKEGVELTVHLGVKLDAEDLLDFAPRAGFSLPGASALLYFSDLLGEEPGSPAAPPERE